MAKVTVIIPVHRVDENLYRTIDSVLRQTHCDWELLVVNMGGVEQIDSVVEKYEDGRISFVDGDALSDNIDLVIARSSGEFFTIVHCGDVMHSAKMRIQLKKDDEKFGYCGMLDLDETDVERYYEHASCRIRGLHKRSDAFVVEKQFCISVGGDGKTVVLTRARHIVRPQIFLLRGVRSMVRYIALRR